MHQVITSYNRPGVIDACPVPSFLGTEIGDKRNEARLCQNLAIRRAINEFKALSDQEHSNKKEAHLCNYL